MITLENIVAHLPRIVGEPIDRRWTRASLVLKGSDGISRETLFNGMTVEQRIKLVNDKMTSGENWSPLLLKDIPKGASKQGTRPICWATCKDAAVIYALTDIIGPSIEARLSDVAVAYRPQKRMTDSIISAVSRARSRWLTTVCVIDVQSFYDSIPWDLLDKVVDELPADPDVKSMLKQLVRVEVRRVPDGTVVQRGMGIPQGLALSPMLANLCMASFDVRVAAACGKLGCIIRRYADDIILFCPSVEAGERARELVRRQLGSLSLRMKEGTGEVADLSVEGKSATWLGIRLRGISTERGATVIAMDIPEATIESKAAEMKAELEAGLTTREDVEQSLGHLGMYWEGLVPTHQARKAIQAIREQVLAVSGTTRHHGDEQSISGMNPGMSNKKEVLKNTETTIEEVIHPYSRTSRTIRDEDGKRETGRMALRAGPMVGIKKEERRLPGGSPQAPQRPMDRRGEDARNGAKDDGSFPCTTPRASKDRIGVPTPHGVDGSVPIPLHGGADPLRGASDVVTLTELELHRSDDLRVVSTGRDGMPAVLHPIRFRKQIVVRAEAGARRASSCKSRSMVFGDLPGSSR